MAAASATTTAQTPPTAESEVPALLGKKRRIQPRQQEETHGEVDENDHDERKQSREHGGVRPCVGSMFDLSGIELARDHCAFTFFSLLHRPGGAFGSAVALAPRTRRGLGAAQPP
jgi:hypothetical protein